MCGPAGSGKSTVARQYERAGHDPPLLRPGGLVARHHHDAAAGRRPPRHRSDAARTPGESRAQAGSDVVLDFSFWSRRMRDDYRALLHPSRRAVPETVYLATDRGTGSQRVGARAGRPRRRLPAQHRDSRPTSFDHFEPPTEAEGPLTVLHLTDRGSRTLCSPTSEPRARRSKDQHRHIERSLVPPIQPPAPRQPRPRQGNVLPVAPPPTLARSQTIAAPSAVSSNTATSRRDYGHNPSHGTNGTE